MGSKNNGIVKISDVAKLANVSISTVSRVLTGSAPVNDDAKARVLDAVKVLGYRPNTIARSLKGGSTNTVALMIPSIRNMIFPSLVRGVEDTGRKYGYKVILCNTDEDIEVEKQYISKLMTRWVDGLIIASMLPDSDHIRELAASGFPVVLTFRYYDETIDAVGVDNVSAAYDAVKYLINTGHRRIAIAMGRQVLNIYRDRFKGYCQALEDHGIPFDPQLVLPEGSSPSCFTGIIRKICALPDPPDAIFATSDPKAITVMRALRDCGQRVPEDVSVIGFDNIEISALLEPPLSTVSQPIYDIGALAAKKLIDQIRHKESTGELMPPSVDLMDTELIIRKSTR